MDDTIFTLITRIEAAMEQSPWDFAGVIHDLVYAQGGDSAIDSMRDMLDGADQCKVEPELDFD